MDQELYLMINETKFNGFRVGEMAYLLEVSLDGETSDDFSFEVNDWFSPDEIALMVESNLSMRLRPSDVMVTVFPLHD